MDRAAEFPGRSGLALSDLTLGYDRHPAVHHLHGTIEPGALLAVIGPNGGGKSTLLKGIAGQIKPLGGAIANAFAQSAYMPQIGELSRDFPVTALELATSGLCAQRGMFHAISRDDRERARAALASVGLAGFERRPIRTLSGGQMQRVLFARLILQDAPLLLLDEPFAAIDARTIADLLVIIEQWHAEARTIIAVLHDLDIVRRHFPQTLLIAREPIAWGPTATVLTEPNLRRARAMSEAFDSHAAECGRAA